MAFDAEGLLQWNQLSQSLQDRFKNLEDQIAENARRIALNKQRLDNLQSQLPTLDQMLTDLDKLIDDRFAEVNAKIKNIRIEGGYSSTTKDFILNAEPGQIAKIDPFNKVLYPHDNLILAMVYSTEEEKNQMLALGESYLAQRCAELDMEVSAYDLENNMRYIDFGFSYCKTTNIGDSLQRYCWIVNPFTHIVYFYYFPGVYVNMYALCDNETGTVYTLGKEGGVDVI